MKRIELTDSQRAELKPLFDEIKATNRGGDVCLIAAQVWEDGIIAKVVAGDSARALANATGGGKSSRGHAYPEPT